MVFVYLDNIVKNVEKIKQISKKDVIAVVKANAYGLSARKIVSKLQGYVSYFFVNNISEYEKIKDLSSNIIVMEYPINSDIQDTNLILTINSLNDALKLKHINYYKRVHLQIDLGMNRYGIKSLIEAKSIIKILKQNHFILIEGIYAHIFVSELNDIEVKEIENNFIQFTKIYSFKMIHLSSTRFLHYDLIGNYVRIGIGLYGFCSKYKLNQAITSYLKINSVKHVSKNEVIGYQPLIQNNVKKDCIIGIINKGYYDISYLETLFYQDIELKQIAVPCMNHRFYLLPSKLKENTLVSLFPTLNCFSKPNYYLLITSLKNEQKIYIEKVNYESKKILKHPTKTRNQIRKRTRSNQTSSPRIIRFRWSNIPSKN